MNVLLIGGSGTMTDAVIDKLNKSSHRVYLLTGQKDKAFSYKRVFERYDFPYDDDSAKDIIESVKPELVIFMGAFDTNFNWYDKGRQESVRYTSSLINILSAYSMIGKGRFVYLSSQEVYGDSYTDNVADTEPVAPKGYKALAISQGEDICRNYRTMQGVDVITLRLDHVYSIPRKGQKETDPCFQMCLEALRTGKISASERNVFSMLYLNDAVELAYKVMVQEKPQRSCYQISSMEEISEMELAKLIKEQMGVGVSLVNTSVGEGRRLILDGKPFQEEYGQKIFTGYKDGVQKAAQYIKRHSDAFIKAEDVGGGLAGRAWHNFKVIFGSLLPFIENLICFIPFYILNDRAASSRYFERLDFLLLYVLLFAVVHGQQQAIVSALLAVFGYFFSQMHGRSGFDVLLDYNTYVWTAQLFIVGMVVGYIKDRLRHIEEEKDEEIRYLKDRIQSLSEINDSNVRMKQNFEAQLVNQKDSLGKVYEITASLEKYGPEEVLFYAAEVLEELMNSRDVAIYVVANDSYARLFSASSPKARKLGNSIEYTAMEEMYGELKERRVYINRTMNDKYPLMASAVYAEDGMQMILMIWGIPWQRMTLAEANRLTIVGTLIQSAVVRARRYLDTLKSSRYREGTNVLKTEAFSLLVKAFFEARDKGLTECTLLEILAKDHNYDKAAVVLESSIRQTDYMGMLEDGRLYVLLSNTNEENAASVAERFRKAGYESRMGKGQ